MKQSKVLSLPIAAAFLASYFLLMMPFGYLEKEQASTHISFSLYCSTCPSYTHPIAWVLLLPHSHALSCSLFSFTHLLPVKPICLCSLSFPYLTLSFHAKLANAPFPGFLILRSPQRQNSRNPTEPRLALLPLLPSWREASADLPHRDHHFGFPSPPLLLHLSSLLSRCWEAQAGTPHLGPTIAVLAGAEDRRKKQKALLCGSPAAAPLCLSHPNHILNGLQLCLEHLTLSFAVASPCTSTGRELKVSQV